MNAFIVLYMLSNFDNVVILSFRFVLLRSMNSCCFILSFVSLFAHFLLIFFFILLVLVHLMVLLYLISRIFLLVLLALLGGGGGAAIAFASNFPFRVFNIK